MKIRKLVLHIVAGAAPIITALAMAAPPATMAAAPTILVDAENPATNCGSYTGKASVADPVAAINGAVTGSTIVICPGTYTLAGEITITDKKLTIKRALSGEQSRPILDIDDTVDQGMDVANSTVTIDGLVIDGRGNPIDYTGINLNGSPTTIRNTTILGPDEDVSKGIASDASGSPKLMSLSISSSTIAGYRDTGVLVMGAVKLNLSSSHLDASDGRRVDSAEAVGVWFEGRATDSLSPTGIVTKSRILNNQVGIIIEESSKVSVTNNVLVDSLIGAIIVSELRSADNNKITGNTILGIPSGGEGVLITNPNAANFTIKKFAVSKNVFVAEEYNSGAVGVLISSDVPATEAITGSITSNTFVGITTFFDPFNGPYAGVTVKGNDVQP
jgi:hypothetical protein